MRVLLIIPDLDGGGAQKVVLTLARGLAMRGHEVHVLIMEHLVAYELPHGITLHTLTPPGRRMSAGWIGKRLLALQLRRWFRAATSKRKFDLVVANLPLTSEIVWLAGIRGVWHHIHNSLGQELERLSRQKPNVANRRRRRWRRIFDGQNLIAVSNGVADDLERRLEVRAGRIVTIYNPFSLAEIQKLAAEPAADLPSQPYVIHAGRFVKQKRHDVLLDAYAASGIPHDLVLLTTDQPALRQLIRSRGLDARVIVAGFRTNPYPWFARAAALVLSSDYEGFGNVLVEAIACGTPAVSTDCPSGPNEILTGALACFLSPVGDAAALGLNLARAINAPPTIDPTSLDRFSLTQALDRIEALASPNP